MLAKISVYLQIAYLCSTRRVAGAVASIRTDRRESLAEYLQQKGIGHGVYYPIPVHRLPSFEVNVDLPQTELAALEVLSIPVHPLLTDEDVEEVIEVLNSWN